MVGGESGRVVGGESGSVVEGRVGVWWECGGGESERDSSGRGEQ